MLRERPTTSSRCWPRSRTVVRSRRRAERSGRKQGPWWGWAIRQVRPRVALLHGRLGVGWPWSRTSNASTTSPSACCPRRARAAHACRSKTRIARLLLESARWLGVGTARDIADYFRIRVTEAKPGWPSSSRRATCSRCEVEGGSSRRSCTRTPCRVASARALLSPFDSLVWEREPHRTSLRHALSNRAVHARPRNGCTATTCCPSCSVTSSWLESTSSPTARHRRCECSACIWKTAGRSGADRSRRRGARAELRSMADWLGLEHVSLAAGAVCHQSQKSSAERMVCSYCLEVAAVADRPDELGVGADEMAQAGVVVLGHGDDRVGHDFGRRGLAVGRERAERHVQAVRLPPCMATSRRTAPP